MFENYDDVVTVEQLAKMLKIGRNTAYELVREERIQSVHIGRNIRIPKNAIIAYLNQNNVKDDKN